MRLSHVLAGSDGRCRVTARPDIGAAVDACALPTTDEVKGVTGADTRAEVESTSGWADWVAALDPPVAIARR